MNRAVAVGSLLFAVTLVGWLCQGGHGEWPQEPPVAADDCGVAQPEKEDPSPGDSTECWEYKNSDGWVRLFDCVEELSCPTVENEPVPGEGCACLKIGDSDSFSFYHADLDHQGGEEDEGARQSQLRRHRRDAYRARRLGFMGGYWRRVRGERFAAQRLRGCRVYRHRAGRRKHQLRRDLEIYLVHGGGLPERIHRARASGDRGRV